jgi:hypothetical protein
MRNNKNEKAYQDELFQQLRIAIPESKPHIEQEKGRNRLDILLYDSIGIELKIYNGEQTTKDLLHQINKYSKDYPFIIGLVVNPSNRDNDLIKQNIEKDLSSLIQNNYKIIVK